MFSDKIEKKAFIVVGKNYGDEGKGQQIARFVHQLQREQKSCLVIKNNGGAQAGHTVVNQGKRNVFHQLGSGTPFGVPTFLGSLYMVDPVQLKAEIEQYTSDHEAGLPDIYASMDCRVTTIYDVIINSLAECNRGDKRHGSCGMGIYETQIRCEDKEHALFLGELLQMTKEQLIGKLQNIRNHYVQKRLCELGINIQTVAKNTECSKWIELLKDDTLLYHVTDIMQETLRYGLTPLTHEALVQFLDEFDSYLFENGQGLLLSEDNEEEYPHVSASMTGCQNALQMIESYIGEIPTEICYVTRSYMTRHGAGKLVGSCLREEISNQVQMDLTNQYNPWQETIRYGKHVSVAEFLRHVKKDIKGIKRNQNVDVALSITHLNETDGNICFVDGDIPVSDFTTEHEIQSIFSKIYTSYDESLT